MSLAPLAVAWLAGLVAGAFLPPGPWRAGVALAAGSAGLFATAWGGTAESPRKLAWGRRLLIVAAALAGVAAGRAPAPPVEVPGGPARVEARVESAEHAGERSRSDLRVVSGRLIEDDVAVPSGALLRVYGRALPEGARVRSLLRLTPRVPFRNPSPHPDLPSWRRIDATARLTEGAPVEVRRRSAPQALLAAARNRVRTALTRTLPPRAATVARAVTLGEGRAVPEEDRETVRRAGLAHVLAVSGLHVAIVAGLCAWLAARLWLWAPAWAARLEARRMAAAVGIPCALTFAAFAGGAPSAWRAAITAALGWGLVLAGRRPRGMAVAAGAAVVLSAVAPENVLRPGFLLSVAATAAIVTARMEGGWIHQAFTVSARTLVATAPMVVWWFGAVPLVGLVANVVLVPLASLLLVPLAVVHALLATTLPWLATGTAPLLTALARAFLAGCDAFSHLPWGQSLPPPDALEGVVVAAGCAALLAVAGWRARMAVALATALALGGAELWLRHRERPEGVLRATFLDVGQGDAALVDLPDGRAMLIDTGGVVRGRDPGAHVLAPLLAARRRARVEVVVLSHPHPDHFAGLAALLPEVDVGEIWTTRQAEIEQPDGPMARLLEEARARGTRVRYPNTLCGTRPSFGEARVEVLAPCRRYDPGYDPNDNSLVVRVHHGRRSLLFSGDLETHGEAALVERLGADLRADVLKVPHHGSNTSSIAPFLDAVCPRVAVISAGVHNRFGHPAPEVVARYDRIGAFLARTDRMGGLVVSTDGRNLEAESWRGDRWTAQSQPANSRSASTTAGTPSGPGTSQSTATCALAAPRSR